MLWPCPAPVVWAWVWESLFWVGLGRGAELRQVRCTQVGWAASLALERGGHLSWPSASRCNV